MVLESMARHLVPLFKIKSHESDVSKRLVLYETCRDLVSGRQDEEAVTSDLS